MSLGYGMIIKDEDSPWMSTDLKSHEVFSSGLIFACDGRLKQLKTLTILQIAQGLVNMINTCKKQGTQMFFLGKNFDSLHQIAHHKSVPQPEREVLCQFGNENVQWFIDNEQ